MKAPNPSGSRRSLQTTILVLAAISLIIFALGGYLTSISRYVLNPLVAVQTWLATRYQVIQNMVSAPQDLGRLQQRNAQLEAENARLQAEIVNLQQQLTETNLLSSLVDFARVHPDYKYVAASVIGRDTSPFLQYVIINRGSDDGLRRGMPVVTQQGLVGRIAAVTAGAARVQLITDNNSAINIRIGTPGVQAMLLGSETGDISLDMIPQGAKLESGELVVTSGQGGAYPANIIIGQVTSVLSRDTDLFQRASVQPMVDFSKLDIVLVIANFRSVDVSPLIPTANVP